jgi:hypothetical protein
MWGRLVIHIKIFHFQAGFDIFYRAASRSGGISSGLSKKVFKDYRRRHLPRRFKHTRLLRRGDYPMSAKVPALPLHFVQGAG